VTNIFDDEKILLIESMPDADAVLCIWFKLLCLAGRVSTNGVLLLNNRIAFTDEMLSTIFRRPVNTVRMALQTFQRFGMIDIIEGTITIPNWSKHQNLDQIEANREYMRTYMQERREKQRTAVREIDCKLNSKSNGKSNVSGAELDKERELIVVADTPEPSRKKKVALSLDEYALTDKGKEAVQMYIDHRAVIKKPLNQMSLTLVVKNLRELGSYQDEAMLKIVEQSVVNGWQGLFELKSNGKAQQPPDEPKLPKLKG
jgi:predicted phage replisome organizer